MSRVVFVCHKLEVGSSNRRRENRKPYQLARDSSIGRNERGRRSYATVWRFNQLEGLDRRLSLSSSLDKMISQLPCSETPGSSCSVGRETIFAQSTSVLTLN
ncbi:hypothetical protein ABW19_dt0204006 [Dactylella cylindrospora]|nr:hypothetical protein ABW19_dt0204006 [Dactylella cylindrospora]